MAGRGGNTPEGEATTSARGSMPLQEIQSPDPELLLTPRQVGRMLGISARQVLRLSIPQVRFGHRTIRYRRQDVVASIQKNTTN
jgi:hypothetical protein